MPKIEGTERSDTMLRDLIEEIEPLLRMGRVGMDWEDHPGQALFRKSQARIRVAMCSNRWGKSDLGAREARYFMLGDHPWFPELIHLPGAGWAVSSSKEMAWEITVPKLNMHLPPEEVRHYPNKVEPVYETRNGSMLRIKSCEQRRGAFQGTDRTFIWWDDIEGDNPELAEECFKEGMMRIGAGTELWSWITMTPVCGMTGLIESLLERESRGDVFVVRGSIYDNPHLTDSERARALSGLTEQWEREAREFGKVTLLGGSYPFDMAIVQARLREPEPEYKLRQFRTGEELLVGSSVHAATTSAIIALPADPIIDKHNRECVWKIWEPCHPQGVYIVAVDPASGYDESDWTVLKVFMLAPTIREVACLRARIGIKATAREAMRAALHYNVGLLIIEVTGLGVGVVEDCREYPNLYHRMDITKDEPKPTSRIGWSTNDTLKEKMIKNLSELVSAGAILLREQETWREMTHFVRDPRKLTLNARRGKTDDGIMCAALSVQGALAPHVSSFFPALQRIVVPGG